MAGYARRAFMLPLPKERDFDELNGVPLEITRAPSGGSAGGAVEATIGARLKRDRAAFFEGPAASFDDCDVRPARVSSHAKVSRRTADCSVPVAHGLQDALMKG